MLTIVGATMPAGAITEGPVIAQHDHEYVPHVQTAMVGQELQILNEIPPGAYTLRAWHEALGGLNTKITIVAGQEVMANFDIGT